MKDQRTISQNSALHLYFEMIARTLNDNNLGVTIVLKPDTKWSAEGVKELMWRPIQKAMLGKDSTAKLKKHEVTEVYDVMNKALSERFGIFIDFPHYEEKKQK